MQQSHDFSNYSCNGSVEEKAFFKFLQAWRLQYGFFELFRCPSWQQDADTAEPAGCISQCKSAVLTQPEFQIQNFTFFLICCLRIPGSNKWFKAYRDQWENPIGFKELWMRLRGPESESLPWLENASS